MCVYVYVCPSIYPRVICSCNIIPLKKTNRTETEEGGKEEKEGRGGERGEREGERERERKERGSEGRPVTVGPYTETGKRDMRTIQFVCTVLYRCISTSLLTPDTGSPRYWNILSH